MKNDIADNNSGIMVNQGTFNTLRANAVTGNHTVGIQLGDGGNQMLAAPVITFCNKRSVSGTACTGCLVDIFSDMNDQGAIYEGSTMTDSSGAFTFSMSAAMSGPKITATATDSQGNSSGFSAPQTFSPYTYSPKNYGFSPSSGTGSINVTSPSDYSWTATSNDSWITITSGSSTTGNGTVTYNVDANTTGSHRKGTLTLPGTTITIRQAGSTFWDVPENVFKPYIYSIYTEGITVGCGSGMYCPSNNVTRGQMAAFIIRSKFGESFSYTTTPYYSDVPDTHTFFKYIQKLKDEGITVTTGTYMVDDIVTREQMAAFIIRAKYGETFSYTTTPYYSDVPSTNTFFKYVQKMKDDAITTTTGTYMASSNVTREQMAAFLGRALLGME